MKAKKLVKIVLFAIILSGLSIQSMTAPNQTPKQQNATGCEPGQGFCI